MCSSTTPLDLNLLRCQGSLVKNLSLPRMCQRCNGLDHIAKYHASNTRANVELYPVSDVYDPNTLFAMFAPNYGNYLQHKKEMSGQIEVERHQINVKIQCLPRLYTV